mmetsp:Transcript_27052/g.63303  ORF Transcript_27052/g.63303 Transcript_27052/m.63303 type:complete len:970 (-) Transcript_27052:126-3035(-)
MAASLSYAPEPHEQAYYLALFRAADVQQNGIISGAEAVQFFSRSKLPIEVLKNIWTVADQPSTSSLDHKKFAVAVRIIQLTQNGTKGAGPTLAAPPGIQLKPVFFEGVSGVSAPLPQQQQGPPPPTPQQPQRAMPPPVSPQRTMQQQQQQQQQQAPPQPQPIPQSPSRALVGMDPYAITPQELSRYEGLFPQYAKTEADGKQFVYGSEAVPLFMKSGVDPNKLRDIWNMVDRNPVDNRLDKLEFALAMHLIVCISKKNLPMPQGGILPSSLQALKVSAQPEPAPGFQQQPSPPPLQQPLQQKPSMDDPPPLGSVGSGALGGMSITDAFEGLSAEPTLPSYVPDASVATAPPLMEEPAPAPVPPQTSYDEPQPGLAGYGQQPLYGQAPPVEAPVPAPAPVVEPPAAAAAASVATYEVSNSQHEELEKLRELLQNLKAENIALKSQLGNMTEEEKQVQQQLGQTVTEITALTVDLGAQRQQVLEAKNRLLEARAELKSQKDTKEVLTELISEAQQTKDAIESATETLQAAQAAAPAPAAETVDFFYMDGPPAPTAAAAETPAAPEGFENEMPGGVASLPSATTAVQNPTGDMAPPHTPQQQAPPAEQPQYPPQAAAASPPPAMYPGYAATPPAAGYPAPAPIPENTPVSQRPAVQQQQLTPTNLARPPPPGHTRQGSGFDTGFLMGGSASSIPQDDGDTFSQAAHSHASTGDYGYDDQVFEIVEEMKKKAKRADGAARDAEAASSKLAAEADELRADADKAEANYRSLVAAADEKKKGRFGGGKKKKMKEGADQAGRDAAEIKKHFMAVQGQALEAATIAAQTRSEADRLRDEAEAAELQMAAAASAQQKQPAPSPSTNGYSTSPKPDYGGQMAAQQQQQQPAQMPQYGQMMPASNPMGGYGNYTNGQYGAADAYVNPYGGAPMPQMSLPDPSQSAPGVMSAGGGYGMPSPSSFQQMAPAPAGGDPYANPF